MAAEAQLVEKIQNQFNVIFVAIDNITEGSACSVLFAHKYINNEQPLLIANSDQIIDIRIAEFISDCQQRNLDGSILTFIDNNLDPKWSYAKLDDDQLVSEVQEKKPISNFATVGIYLFQQGHYFVDAAIEMIIKQDRVNNEYYTCPAYNYIIQSGKKIGIYNIPVEKMHGIGTPTDFEKYLITL
jgi:dTDP-glucose pyrophosphorylase